MFDTFLKENKKVLIIIASCLTASVLALIVFNFISQNNNEVEDEITVNVVNPYELPEISTVSITQQPVLYDYINGSLGLHEDMVSLLDPNPFFTFISKDDSSRLFVTMNYGHQSSDEFENLMPIFSSAPVRVDLDAVQMESFKNDIDVLINANEVKPFTEGEYTFCVVPYSVVMIDNNSMLKMIDFNWVISKYEPGVVAEQALNGVGVPTEIIREKCDVEALKKASGIDFNDKFWDNVNYNSMIKVYKRDDKSEFCIISPIFKELVAGYGDPINMFTVNGVDLMMDVNKLNDYLMEKGYQSIDDALTAQSYATQKEFEKKQNTNI